MSRVAYIARDGGPMAAQDWQAKQSDAAYCTVAEYDNGTVRLEIKWVGKVPNPGMTLPEYWPVFRVSLGNYADGRLRPDPVDHGKTFSTEKDALEFYRCFLLKWTESSLDDDGELIEEGNLLAPPPPPDPNRPSTDLSAVKGLMDDGVGAW